MDKSSVDQASVDVSIGESSERTAKIATRSREALQRHQARLDKMNELKTT